MSTCTQTALATLALIVAVLFTLAAPSAAVLGVLPPAYTLAYFVVPRMQEISPPGRVVRILRALSIVGCTAFGVSLFLEIGFVASPGERWSINAGAIIHTVYRSPLTATAPEPPVRWAPRLIPTPLPLYACGGRGGIEFCSAYTPAWPLLTSILLPSLVLASLRRERALPDSCRFCGYNLTGNVSGRCPECGGFLEPDRAASLE